MSTRLSRNSKCLKLASDTFFPPFPTSPTIQFRWNQHCLNLETQFCNSICFLPWQSVYCGKSKTKLLFRQVLCEIHWREENLQLFKHMTKEWNQLLDMKICYTGNMTMLCRETHEAQVCHQCQFAAETAHDLELTENIMCRLKILLTWVVLFLVLGALLG